MTVQRVAKDVFTWFTQSELLRCRRTVASVAGPPVHKKKDSLIDELTQLSRDEDLRCKLYEHLLRGHCVANLSELLSLLRCRGYSVPSHSARRADLLKAIVHTSEEAPSTGGARPTVRDAPFSSCAGETCDVMVAFESSADPNNASRKMRKRWGKLLKKATAKRLRRHKLRLVKAVLQEEILFDDSRTIAALRAVVSRRLDIRLEGKHRLVFDKALLSITQRARPEKQRRRARFKLAPRAR